MKEINKQISQFLDDELHHHELESLLVKINQKPELKNKLDRYQAVSHALRTDKFIKTNNDFLQNISNEIQQEPHHFLPKQRDKRKPFSAWQKVSVAMAASVACVSIVVSQQDLLQQPAASPDALIISQKAGLAKIKAKVSPKQIQVVQVATKSKDLVIPKTKTQNKNTQHERFKAYLRAHSDDLYTHGSLSVRLAGYEQ